MPYKLLSFVVMILISFNSWGQLPLDIKERSLAFFDKLSMERMDLVEEFYDQKAVFEDPLGRHSGVASIRSYYEGLYQNVEEIKFSYPHVVQEGQRVVLVWVMKLKSGLKKGEFTYTNGSSIIEFNNEYKVIYHRDFFDMNEFVYQHVPVLSGLLNFINNKLKAK